MKYVRILRENVPVWGIVEGDAVRTLAEPPYEGLKFDGKSVPLAGCKLLAPCTPTKIVCVGKNYADHAREMGSEPPEQPVLFLKGPNTLNDPEGEVHAPDFVERLDYEGELGGRVFAGLYLSQRRDRPGHTEGGRAVDPGQKHGRFLSRGSLGH